MPSVSAIRQQRLTEFRRGEILSAATAVFAARGFDAATVDEVAAAAGVAKGTLYLYFRSKRDIYHAALRSGALDLHRLLEARLVAARSTRDLIRAFVETKIEFYDAHRDFFRIYHVAVASATSRPAQAFPELRVLFSEQVALLAAGFERMSRAPLRLPSREIAFAVAELTRGLVLRRMSAPPSRRRAAGRASVAADVEFALRFVLHGIGSTRV